MYLDVNWAIFVDQYVIKHFDFTHRIYTIDRIALDTHNNNYINNLSILVRARIHNE